MLDKSCFFAGICLAWMFLWGTNHVFCLLEHFEYEHEASKPVAHARSFYVFVCVICFFMALI